MTPRAARFARVVVLLLTAGALLAACLTACVTSWHPPKAAARGPAGAAASPARPAPPRSFDRAKQLAWGIYRDHRFTFYCNCAYGPVERPIPQSCGYSARRLGSRASRIEWEHIVPAFAFGAHRACWIGKTCADKQGRAFGGRRCCRARDAEFRRMEADLHNLVPEIGELNGDRSNFGFGEVAGEPRSYGACDFEVDRSTKTVEPAPEIRGDIARAYLYMHAVYGQTALPLTDAELEGYERWHRADPVSVWERLRNARITTLQRAGNALIRP